MPVIAWTHAKPKTEGYYLRYNIRITLHFIKDMDSEFPDQGFLRGDMWLSWGEAGMKRVMTLSEQFYWYGPIPNTPE